MKRLAIRNVAGRFRFVTDCIGSTFEDIRDLIDNGDVPISMRTFAIAVGPHGWRQLSDMLDYDKYFPLSRDQFVGYYRGTFREVPAVYTRHSAIEYIFTLDGKVGPSAAPPDRDNNGGCSLLARHHRDPATHTGFNEYRRLPIDEDRGNPLDTYGVVHADKLGLYWTVAEDVPIRKLSKLRPVVQSQARLKSVDEARKLGRQLPPIELGVFENGSAWIVDGNHRLASARKARLPSLPVIFTFIGT